MNDLASFINAHDLTLPTWLSGAEASSQDFSNWRNARLARAPCRPFRGKKRMGLSASGGSD